MGPVYIKIHALYYHEPNERGPTECYQFLPTSKFSNQLSLFDCLTSFVRCDDGTFVTCMILSVALCLDC